MTTHALPPGALPYDSDALHSAQAGRLVMARTERITLRYVWSANAFLVVAGLLGILIRMDQATLMSMNANVWYALMTLHGLGAFVAWGAFALMGLSWWLLARVGLPMRTFVFAEISYWSMMAGAIGIVISCLFYRFGASWVFLYPLPFHSAGQWNDATVGMFAISVLFVGVSLLAYCAGVVHTCLGPAIQAAKDTLGQRLGIAMGLGILWPSRFRRRDGSAVPYPVLPLMVNALVMFIVTLPFALLLVFMVIQAADPGFSVDPLLAKNLLWVFGHPVVYMLLFPAVAVMYYLVPRYAGRPLVAGRLVAIAWLLAFVVSFVVWAHHIYMDYPNNSVQSTINTLMEPTTFTITFPSTLSIYSLLATMYRSAFRWTTASLFLVAGLFGWMTAGLQGLVNATIKYDAQVHNTMWVVGHFHHMAFLGIGMMILGAMYYAIPQLTHRPLHSERLGRVHLWGTLVGGYVWVGIWLLQGLQGLPRRWVRWPARWEFGNYLTLPFIAILVAAQVVGLYNILMTVRRRPWSERGGPVDPVAHASG